MARQKLEKTNAIRLLEAKRVPYEALSYDAEIHSAVSVAEALAVPAKQVYKTLVVLREEQVTRPLLVMIAGSEELDLRLLARSIGTKAARMAPHRDAERLTGLQVGGIGALALVNRPFEPCIERAALDHEWVLVNGGRRGLNLRVGVQDLIKLTGARVVDAVRREPMTSPHAQMETSPPDPLLHERWGRCAARTSVAPTSSATRHRHVSAERGRS